MTRYFIKIKEGYDDYRKLCFDKIYENEKHMGDLIFRYINNNVPQHELAFLKDIDCTIHVFTDQTKLEEVINVMRNDENKDYIKGIESIYVNGNHPRNISETVIPKCYLKGSKISEYYYVNVEEDCDYTFRYFKHEFPTIEDCIRLYCWYKEKIYDKNNRDFYNKYEEWLKEYDPDFPTIIFDKSKEKEYDFCEYCNVNSGCIYFTLKEIFEWLYFNDVERDSEDDESRTT